MLGRSPQRFIDLAVGWLCALLFALTCAQARADGVSTEPGEPANYRPLIDEALREFEAQNFEEARSLFLRAHALYPNARSERALGLAEFELRNYVASVEHLELALSSSVKQLTPELRRQTEGLLTRAFGFIARIQLHLTPSSARFFVDGQPVLLRAGQPLRLGIGSHTLEARAPGLAAEAQSMDVAGGEELTLSFVLTTATEPSHQHASASSATGAARPDGPRRPLYKSPWLWTGVGLVLAGVIGGTVYALTRDHDAAGVYGGSTNTFVAGP